MIHVHDMILPLYPSSQFSPEQDAHEYMVFRMDKEEAHFRLELEQVRRQGVGTQGR